MTFSVIDAPGRHTPKSPNAKGLCRRSSSSSECARVCGLVALACLIRHTKDLPSLICRCDGQPEFGRIQTPVAFGRGSTEAATMRGRTPGIVVLGIGFMAMACSAGDEHALQDEWVDSASQGLAKPRGVNGAGDYCNNAAAPCVAGEGDCDSHAQCANGSICASNVGPKYLMPTGHDVCAPAHCTNRVLDGDETFVDCGGSCSAPGFVCQSLCQTLQPGDAAYCSPGCPCTQGQGDCDSDVDCNPGLVCGSNLGPQFGMPVGHDVCVPAHCKNRVRDGNETFTNCGGSCSSPSSNCTVLCDRYPLGHSSHCSADCPCGVGEGDCDSSSHCDTGLVCGRDRGVAYGTTSDVCTPAHCVNRIQDADETSVDVGGECGGCITPSGIGPCTAPAVGAPCPNNVCVTGALCLNGICAQVVGESQSCDCDNCICADGLDCFSDGSGGFTCQDIYAQLGEPCISRPCAPGLICDPEVSDPTCLPTGGLGGFCLDSCNDEALYCDFIGGLGYGTCVYRSAEGELCWGPDASCQDGLSCIDWSSEPSCVPGPMQSCIDSLCTPREGQSCAATGLCVPGLSCVSEAGTQVCRR